MTTYIKANNGCFCKRDDEEQYRKYGKDPKWNYTGWMETHEVPKDIIYKYNAEIIQWGQTKRYGGSEYKAAITCDEKKSLNDFLTFYFAVLQEQRKDTIQESIDKFLAKKADWWQGTLSYKEIPNGYEVCLSIPYLD